ncbi:MAG: hypothetical protein AAF649_02005 [Verrucomicrobiota bacterium]
MNEEPIQEVDQQARPFVLEKRGGTHVILSLEELHQRWEQDKCQASDRIIDKRTGKQFPAVALGLLAGLEKNTGLINMLQ